MKIKIAAAVSVAILLMWCCFDIAPVHSHIVQPPAGNHGNPTSIPPGQTCAQCHAGGGLQPATGLVDIKIGQGMADTLLENFKYQPNATYVMSFVPHATSKRHGFQISALNGANDNGGSFVITDANHTSVVSVPINYVQHKNASGFKDWTFNWTAPDTGTVTFYYTFVSADSNGQNTNDTVYEGTTTIQPKLTGIYETSLLQGVNIYPLPAHNVLNITVDNIGAEEMDATIYSMDGKLVKKVGLNNHSQIPLTDVSPGMYLLKVTSGNKIAVKKLLVE